jgi:hypothetical protein
MLKRCQGCAGLANPGPVATALWTDTELDAGVTLDGIVTVSSWSALLGPQHRFGSLPGHFLPLPTECALLCIPGPVISCHFQY